MQAKLLLTNKAAIVRSVFFFFGFFLGFFLCRFVLFFADGFCPSSFLAEGEKL